VLTEDPSLPLKPVKVRLFASLTALITWSCDYTAYFQIVQSKIVKLESLHGQRIQVSGWVHSLYYSSLARLARMVNEGCHSHTGHMPSAGHMPSDSARLILRLSQCCKVCEVFRGTRQCQALVICHPTSSEMDLRLSECCKLHLSAAPHLFESVFKSGIHLACCLQSATSMSDYELLTQYTEDAYAKADRICDRPSCQADIRTGEPCFYIATIEPGQHGRYVCASCHVHYGKKRATSVRPTGM
jgi:hypothetical protein